ncbi:MAG: cytochrome c biogenesis protein ResB [bacterium]
MRSLISRTTIIFMIVAMLCALTLTAFIPQRFATTTEDMVKWQAAHPNINSWADILGLYRIYTHPLFALILTGVVTALSISAWNQCAAAWRRTFAWNRSDSAVDLFETSASSEAIGQCLAGRGFLRLNERGGVVLMVRHPWGYWGNALLHLGMMTVIAASLLVALTQRYGIVQISSGFKQLPDEPLLAEEHGMLAGPLKLAEAIRMDHIAYSFRPDTYGLQSLVSTVSFLSPTGPVDTKKVEINSILHHKGVRYYQGVEFGHAFFVEISGPSGQTEKLQLLMRHPKTPDQASYDTLKDLLGDGYVLKAKYVVNQEMKSFDRVDPLLTLRIDQNSNEVGRLTLKTGGEGLIGLHKIRLVGFESWSRLIIADITGLPGVFFGFIIICLGGFLHYFTPPQEITLRWNSGACTLAWRAVRFAGLYRNEYEQMRESLGGRVIVYQGEEDRHG